MQCNKDKKKSHHVSGFVTAIERIPTINIVNHNPIDYMHRTCSGLMKRSLEIWIKICPSFKETVDELIIKMQDCWPVEFKRRVRSIKFINNFKASEYRVWLLYIAPAVMKHFLLKEQYDHFSLVHHGIRLLFLKAVPIEENLNLAQKCNDKFLNQWSSVYNT